MKLQLKCRLFTPTLVLLLTLFAVAVAVAEEPVVRVADGSFEAIATDAASKVWVLNGSGSIDRTTAHDGRASARLSGPNRFQSEWVHSFGTPLVPGREYVISAWVKASAEGSIASLGLRWPGGDTRIYRGLRPEDGWQKLELEFTVPASGPAWIQVVLTGEHPAELWWDNVQIFEAKTIRERLASEWAPRLAQGEQIYTGLVINAKGIGVLRGMSPKIYDDEGRVVYAGVGASGTQLIGHGIVAYMLELEDALSHNRLNIDPDYPLRHPLVIDAIDGADLPRTGVVIRRHDVDVLYAALNEYDFLGRFAVIFVVDREF